MWILIIEPHGEKSRQTKLDEALRKRINLKLFRQSIMYGHLALGSLSLEKQDLILLNLSGTKESAQRSWSHACSYPLITLSNQEIIPSHLGSAEKYLNGGAFYIERRFIVRFFFPFYYIEYFRILFTEDTNEYFHMH